MNLAKRLEQAAGTGRDPDRHRHLSARQGRGQGRPACSASGSRGSASRCRLSGSRTSTPLRQASHGGSTHRSSTARRRCCCCGLRSRTVSASASAGSSRSSGPPESASRGWPASSLRGVDERVAHACADGVCRTARRITFWPLREIVREAGGEEALEALSRGRRRRASHRPADPHGRRPGGGRRSGRGDVLGDPSFPRGARARAAARRLLRRRALGRARRCST